jgi:hypothetical protein
MSRPVAMTLLVAGALFAGCEDRAPAGAAVVVNGERIGVEIADSPSEQFQGLSDRAYLPDGRGMLFVFGRARPRTFVMRRCRFDIDIAFLDDQRRILNLATMTVEPDPDAPDPELTDYNSAGPARYVLEVNGGTWDRIGAAPGQQVEFVNIPGQ